MKSVSPDIIGNIVKSFVKEIKNANKRTRNTEECNQVEFFKKKDREIIKLNHTTDSKGEEHFGELEKDVQHTLSSILIGMNWHEESVDSMFSNSEQSNTSSSNESLDVTLEDVNQVPHHAVKNIKESCRELAKELDPTQEVQLSRLISPDETRHEVDLSEQQRADIAELVKQTDEKSGTCSSITSKTQEIGTDTHKNSDTMLKTLNQVLYQVMDTSIAENFRKLANIKRREFVPTEKVQSSRLTLLDHPTRNEMESSEKQKIDIPELVEQTDEKSGPCSSITSKTYGTKKDADQNSNATLETFHHMLYHIGSQSIPGKFKKLANVKEIEIQSPRTLSSILTGMNWHEQSIDSMFSNSKQSNTSSSNESLDVTLEDVNQVPHHTVKKSIEENFRKLAKEIDHRKEVQSSRLIPPEKRRHEVDFSEKQKADIPELEKQMDEKSGTCSSITSKTQEIETDAHKNSDAMLKTLNQVLYQVMDTSIAGNFRKLANIKRREFVPTEKVQSSRLTLLDHPTRNEMESSEKQKIDIPELVEQTDEKSGPCSSITSKTYGTKKDADQNPNATLKNLYHMLYHIGSQSIQGKFKKLANAKEIEIQSPRTLPSILTGMNWHEQSVDSMFSNSKQSNTSSSNESLDVILEDVNQVPHHTVNKNIEENFRKLAKEIDHRKEVQSSGLISPEKRRHEVDSSEKQKADIPELEKQMDEKSGTCSSITSKTQEIETDAHKNSDAMLKTLNQVLYQVMDTSIAGNFRKLANIKRREFVPTEKVQSSRLTLLDHPTRNEMESSEKQKIDISELVKSTGENSGTSSSITSKPHGTKRDADKNSNAILETFHHILHHIGSQSIPGMFKKLANVKEIEIQSPKLNSAMSFPSDDAPPRGPQILKPSSEKVEKRTTESQVLKSVSSDVIGCIVESLLKQTKDANKNTKNAHENGPLESTKTNDHAIEVQPNRMSDKMQNIFNKRVSSSTIQDIVSDIIQSNTHPSDLSQNSMESAAEMVQNPLEKSTEEILEHKKASVDSVGSHSSTSLQKVINDILTVEQYKVEHLQRLRSTSPVQIASDMEYDTPGQRLIHTCDLPTEDVSFDIIKGVIFDMLQPMTYEETSGSEINSDTAKQITPNIRTDMTDSRENFYSESAVQCTLSAHLDRKEVREKHSDNIIRSLSSEVIRDIIRSVMRNQKHGDIAYSGENFTVSREVDVTQRENSRLFCVVSTIIEDILLKQSESEAAKHANVEPVCHASSKQLSYDEAPTCSNNSPVKSPSSVIERLILDRLRSVVKDGIERNQESCCEENQAISRSATSGHKKENPREESTLSDALRQIISELLARSSNCETYGYANLLSKHSPNNEMVINRDTSKSHETASFDSFPCSTVSGDDMKKFISHVLSLIAQERNTSKEGNPTLFSSSSKDVERILKSEASTTIDRIISDVLLQSSNRTAGPSLSTDWLRSAECGQLRRLCKSDEFSNESHPSRTNYQAVDKPENSSNVNITRVIPVEMSSSLEPPISDMVIQTILGDTLRCLCQDCMVSESSTCIDKTTSDMSNDDSISGLSERTVKVSSHDLRGIIMDVLGNISNEENGSEQLKVITGPSLSSEAINQIILDLLNSYRLEKLNKD